MFFHRLWDNPGGAVKKETLLALELCSRPTTCTSAASATATTCCAVGAHAVGTRYGLGETMGLVSRVGGPEGGWDHKQTRRVEIWWLGEAVGARGVSWGGP